jgi:hypothetical protein
MGSAHEYYFLWLFFSRSLGEDLPSQIDINCLLKNEGKKIKILFITNLKLTLMNLILRKKYLNFFSIQIRVEINHLE